MVEQFYSLIGQSGPGINSDEEVLYTHPKLTTRLQTKDTR